MLWIITTADEKQLVLLYPWDVSAPFRAVRLLMKKKLVLLYPWDVSAPFRAVRRLMKNNWFYCILGRPSPLNRACMYPRGPGAGGGRRTPNQGEAWFGPSCAWQARGVVASRRGSVHHGGVRRGPGRHGVAPMTIVNSVEAHAYEG